MGYQKGNSLLSAIDTWGQRKNEVTPNILC